MNGDALLQTLLSASANPWTALAVKATLTMACALAALRALRRAPASLRHLLAAAAFGVLLLLPLVAALAPARVVTLAARPVAPRVVSVDSQGPEAPRVAAGVHPAAPVRSAGGRAQLPIGTVLAGAYVAGVLAVLASLLGGVVRLYRLLGRAEVSVLGTGLANGLARRAGARGGIQVATSSELAVPMTFGSARPVIVLPAETSAWGEEETARALRHEIEHVTRHDWATQLGARIAFALYWPHPLAWMLWRRLRLEAERACDDAVVRSQGQPETYAGQLVALARRVNGHGQVPALSMATRSNLGLRVEAILDAAARRAPRTRLATAGALAAAFFGLAGVAPVRLMRAAAQEPQAANEPNSPNEPNAANHSNSANDPQPADEPRITRERQVEREVEVEVEAQVEREVEVAVEALAGQDENDTDDENDVDADRDDSLDMRLLQASQRGSLAEMQRLIDAGAKAGAVLQGDGTPLIAAARGGSVEAIDLLLGSGADVNRGVEGDGSPLIGAAVEGHLDAVRVLLARGAAIDQGVPGDGNALIMAAGAGHADVVRFLLDQGAGIETVVPGDENALIHASEQGQAAVVRLLIDRGANVNARVRAERADGRAEWRTPLSMARRKGHAEVERILRAAGARE